MRFLMILLLVLTWSALISKQGSDVSCCRMEIATPVRATELRVSVTNIEQPMVNIVVMGAERSIRIQIRGENGREPPLTDVGKQVLSFSGGSRVPTGLGRNETLTQVLDLEKLYKLAPGTYSVILSRDVSVLGKKVELRATTTIKVVP